MRKCRSFGQASPERETNKTQPHEPAPGTNEPEAPAPNQTSDSHQQAQPSMTGEFREWPDIPPTWELERDARGHLETKPNYPSNSVLGTIARQLLGMVAQCQGLAGAFVWGIGDPFRMYSTRLGNWSDLRCHNLT